MTIDEQILQVAHQIGARWRGGSKPDDLEPLLEELADLTRPRQDCGDPHTFAADGSANCCDCMICGEGRLHYLHEEREIRHG